MDNLRRRISLTLWAVLLPVAAWPFVAGGVWAEWAIPSGPTALFSPKPNQYVLVRSTPLATVPNGWEPLETAGAYTFISPQAIEITRTETGWSLTPTASPQAAPAASTLLLNNRWQLGGRALQRSTVVVNGTPWQVGLTPFRHRNGAALLGVAQRGGAVVAASKASTKKEETPLQQKTEAALQKFVKFEPAAGLTAVAMPSVSETELFTSVRNVLEGIGVMPLRALPSQIYQPGFALALPNLTLANALPPLPVAPVTLSPTFDVETHPDHISGTASISASGVEADHAEAATAKEGEGNHGTEHGDEHSANTETATASLTSSPTVIAPREVLAEAENETAADDTTATLFPKRGTSAFREITEALQAVADAPPGSVAGREARLALSGVYLGWQRPEEAAAVLQTLPRRTDGLPAGAAARLLLGVAQLASGQTPLPNVFDQTGSLETHAALWRAVGHAQARNYSLAAQQWPTQKGILPGYPAYLREQAQKAQLESLLMTGQQAVALQGVEAMIKSYPPTAVPPSLYRLKGLALLGTENEQEGLEALAKAAENPRDATTATRAKLDFIRALHQRRDVSDVQLREYLETLQQDWRGDDTERQMLSLLADLYEKNREPQKALQTWQTLVQAYPRTPELPIITSRMAQAFVNVYDPEIEQPFDSLTALGLYFDFRELLPGDARGDRVQELMAEQLVKNNLFARAIPILEQQLKFRPLEDVARGRLTLLLADAYRRDDRPEEAVTLLNANRSLATTQVLRRGWALSEARALGDLQRPQAGAALLKPLLENPEAQDKEAQQVAADLAWQGQDWAGASTQFAQLLAPVPAAQLISDTAAQLQLFRLAYALGQQGRAPELAQLKARYQEAWSKLPRLADDLNAVAATAGVEGVPPGGGPMQALTTALAGLNTLDDTIAQTRRKMQESRENLDEYNKRMQYLDLLPPPAL